MKSKPDQRPPIPAKYKRGKRYKTVAGLVRHSIGGGFAKIFAKAERDRKALIAKYANDPNHKHVREEVGSIRQVTSGASKGFKILKKPILVHTMYWCKICHADMD